MSRNELDIYDTEKLKEARNMIYKVYQSNYVENSSLTNRLNTILSKLDLIINANS